MLQQKHTFSFNCHRVKTGSQPGLTSSDSHELCNFTLLITSNEVKVFQLVKVCYYHATANDMSAIIYPYAQQKPTHLWLSLQLEVFCCSIYVLVFYGYLPSCRILDSGSQNCCSPRTPASSASFLQLDHSARSQLFLMYFVLWSAFSLTETLKTCQQS